MWSRQLSKLGFRTCLGAAALKGNPLERAVVKLPERSHRFLFLCAAMLLSIAPTIMIAMPAEAATRTTPSVSVNNSPIQVGTILTTYPRTSKGCILPSKGLPNVKLNWKRRAPTPYVNVRLNKQCQFVVTATGTDAAETPIRPATDSAASRLLRQKSKTGTAPQLQSTATCSYQDHVEVVDLSSFTTNAEVTNWMNYNYQCGGNTLYSGSTNSNCYWNALIGYELYDCSASWDYFSGGSAESYGSGFDQNNPYPGVFYQGTLGVTNTINASTWEITANCSWGGTLANSGDTFHCAAYSG